MMEEGIATISFFKGDFAPAKEALRSQLALVVASNPWLCGRLVKTKAGVRLRHPAEPSATEIDSLFTATSADEASSAFKLTPSSPYAKICTDMYSSKKVIVGNGYALVGKDKPVALLTLAESTPGNFALVFSLSHVVGDGRTYYEIFKMLQPGAAVRGLACTRVMRFSESMREECGKKELAWADSTSALCMMLPTLMGCVKKARCFAFHLDDEKLAAAKATGAADGKVPYVTTNDILTSGFFKECGARMGWMGMDCRGKLEGFDKDLAGNYVSLVYFVFQSLPLYFQVLHFFFIGCLKLPSSYLPRALLFLFVACMPFTTLFNLQSNQGDCAGGGP